MKLIVYSSDTNKHVATITGETNEACERAAEDQYGSNDYGWTYSPSWGMSGGLIENSKAEKISA
jgi:hypothetical protein